MARLSYLLDYLKTTSFYEDPASSKYHGAYKGGLYEHSKNVLKNLLSLTHKNRLLWNDPESPYIIAWAHDICKIGAYLPDGFRGYVWNQNHPRGHGDLSVIMTEKVIDLTQEEKACIRWHMGAFDERSNWTGYTEAIRNFENVLWVHTADMMAAHIDEVR